MESNRPRSALNSVQEQPYAWVMLFVSTLTTGMAFGAIVNIAVFLKPLAAEFGWLRGDLAFAYTVVTLSTGVGGILMGHFSDRLSVKGLVLFGSIMPGLAFFLLSGISSLRELYLYHIMIGFLGFGAILVPLTNILTFWFNKNRGLAIGISSAGGALGQGLMPFLSRNLILWQGWREAYFTMGVIYMMVLVPLVFLVRRPPNYRNESIPDSAINDDSDYGISRKKLVMLMSLAVLFCCTCMATPIVHIVALGSDAGLGPRQAAGLLTTMMIFGMLGRIVSGRIADRIGNLKTYIIASVAQTVLAMWIPYINSLNGLYIIAALFGFGYSGVMTCITLCTREFAPIRHTGVSLGIVVFFGWAGMGFGSWQGGLFYDLQGDYYQAFLNSTLAGVGNLMILALIYHYTIRKSPRLAFQY